MSEERDILLGTAERIFAAIATPEHIAEAERGVWNAASWRMIEEAGLPLALVPEEQGGFGFAPVDALAVLRLAGAHAVPFPLAETMIANRLLALSGLPLPDGIVTIAGGASGDTLTLAPTGEGWRVAGRLARVPWGRVAGHVVAPSGDGHLCCLPSGMMTLVEGNNLAGEPRDDVSLEGMLPACRVAQGKAAEGSLRLAGAAARSIMIAGALQRMLEMTVAYAGERVQFGRPIGKFQAIQQYLAVVAGQVAAASAAADLAAEALASDMAALPIAIAKTRTGEAAGQSAALTHQIHGAIGFTYEHSLQHLTRRVWAWRDEFGGEAEWAAMIGREIRRAGSDGLWPLAVAA